MDLIDKLSQMLNNFKDFTAGYSTRIAERNQMLIKYKDKAYVVKFHEVSLPKVTDELRKKYNSADDETIQLFEVLKYMYGDYMIRCPDCGSTAQVRLTNKRYVESNDKYFIEYYKCGCGCNFQVNCSIDGVFKVSNGEFVK